MHRAAALRRTQFKLGATSGESDEKPMVLFVSAHDAGRSRMAQAWLHRLAGDRYRARSAGIEPADRPHPEVAAAMKEVGLDIGNSPGTSLTAEEVDDASIVIGIGGAAAHARPSFEGAREDWDLDDPKGRGPEDVAAIRDLVEIRVRNLVGRLDREASGA